VGLIDSEGAELKGNLIGNNGFGMIGELIDETMITGNQLSGNIEGDIMVMQSKGNHIEDNTMTRGLVVIGQELEHWNTHDIDTTNTVNGNPIYYMKNVEGETVPSDAGQVILANCKDVTIEDLDVNEVIAGILIGFSDDNFIINNDLSQNQIGLFLWESHNNELTENTISNNEVGILLGGFSEGNTLADNNISSNEGGILIEFSNENMLVNNTVENNEVGIAFLLSNQNTVKDNIIADNNQVGISLRHSIDNLLYRNQIIENENQAYDDGNNDWNKEYVIEDEVIGGNYWHDHTEPDEYSGPNQDEPGSDGIVDDPREISGGENVDDYPWTNPQFASPPIEISDPQPKDGAEELGVNTTLSVHVEAGIYPTEVEFYLDDTVVYTETIDSAEMVETDPLDLEGGNTYEWYVETTNDDTANRSVSPTYSFTTEVDEVPGFTSLLLLTASIIAVAIYQKKSTKR